MLGDQDVYVDCQYSPACSSLADVFQPHCGLLLAPYYCLHGGNVAADRPLGRVLALG